MTVSVLVPFGSGCPSRERAWIYVRSHYERAHPSWEFVEGLIPAESPWSKGTALAEAYSRATGEVLVVADADSFMAPEALAEAVELMEARAAWVVPHRRVHRLNRHFSDAVMRGVPPRYGRWARQPYTGVVGGGIVVLNRGQWETVGGIDARFHGWGGEDISFGWALETLCGPPQRLDADLWHLWHPHPAPARRGAPASEALAGRYREARGNPGAMWILVEEAKTHRDPARTAAPTGDHPEPEEDRHRRVG